jgi:hypothetical protein
LEEGRKGEKERKRQRRREKARTQDPQEEKIGKILE